MPHGGLKWIWYTNCVANIHIVSHTSTYVQYILHAVTRNSEIKSAASASFSSSCFFFSQFCLVSEDSTLVHVFCSSESPFYPCILVCVCVCVCSHQPAISAISSTIDSNQPAGGTTRPLTATHRHTIMYNWHTIEKTGLHLNSSTQWEHKHRFCTRSTFYKYLQNIYPPFLCPCHVSKAWGNQSNISFASSQQQAIILIIMQNKSKEKEIMF